MNRMTDRSRRLLGRITALALFLGVGAASAAPAYQMPFPCGQVWRLATWQGHNPDRAVDMNRDNDFGDAVVASAGGTVTTARDLGDTSYGRYVVIDHGNGHSTLYAHLSGYRVIVGESVSKGQRIGSVGSRGTASAHLHYEQRVSGRAVSARFNGVAMPYYAVVFWTSHNSCN
jgi:murein DD-endopeptidase MepM/ murein hydrolase activator NlpD